MATRAVVAVPHGDGWRGRYVHYDGGPETLRPTLYALMVRDGYDTATATLTGVRWGWREVTGAEVVTLREHDDPERVAVVPRYGVEYVDLGTPEWWITPDPHDLRDALVEWVYLLTPDGIATWSVTRGVATPYAG